MGCDEEQELVGEVEEWHGCGVCVCVCVYLVMWFLEGGGLRLVVAVGLVIDSDWLWSLRTGGGIEP